jgi:glutaredoxin
MVEPFAVISKPNCHKCEDLKAWLKKSDVKYDEWSLDDEAVKKKLVIDPKFTEKFCNIDGCMVYTPVIRLNKTGDYFFKEIFNQSGLRVDAVKKILKIK